MQNKPDSCILIDINAWRNMQMNAEEYKKEKKNNTYKKKLKSYERI